MVQRNSVPFRKAEKDPSESLIIMAPSPGVRCALGCLGLFCNVVVAKLCHCLIYKYAT